MQVFVFTSTKPGVYGFTRDKEGINLPGDLGAWSFFKELDLIDPAKPIVGGSGEEILSGIEKNGYFIASAGVRVSETVSKRNA